MAIHRKAQLDDTEKLPYLKHAIKDRPARHVIDSWTQDAECCKEVIECLRKRYDQPHVIH